MVSYLLFVALLQPSLAEDISVNCGEAKTQADIIICAPDSYWLRSLNRLMAEHYQAALERSSSHDQKLQLISDQQSWNKQVKQSCASKFCLNNAYKERIESLAKWNFHDHYCGEHRYPPYPDIWGYNLDNLDNPGYKYAGRLYKVPGGEVWFDYQSVTDNEWTIRCLFSGAKRKGGIPHEYVVYAHSADVYKGSLSSARFADGATLIRENTLDTSTRCSPGHGNHLTLRAADGRLLKEVSLVARLKTPYKMPHNADCEATGNKRYTLRNFDVLSPESMVLLNDNTVLLTLESAIYDTDAPGYLIRFDRDLNTKFTDKDLFIVDYREIEEAYAKGGDFQDHVDNIEQAILKALKDDKGE